MDITVPRGYGGSLQSIDSISLHYVNNSLLNLGMVIKCYDVERTICVVIRDKNLLKLVKYSKRLI